MRMSLLGAALFLLAACANANHSGPQSRGGGSGSIVDRAPSLTDDEARDYVADLAEERITAICRDSPSISSQMACVRDEIFLGFDTTGEAKRHCDADAPIKDLMRCAVLGSLGYELALAAGLPQADDYNWRDPDAGLKEAVDSLAKAQVDICMNKAISGIDQCLLDGFGAAFALSDRQIATCTDQADQDKSINCLIRVYLVERFESAVARMSPGAGVRV